MSRDSDELDELLAEVNRTRDNARLLRVAVAERASMERAALERATSNKKQAQANLNNVKASGLAGLIILGVVAVVILVLVGVFKFLAFPLFLAGMGIWLLINLALIKAIFEPKKVYSEEELEMTNLELFAIKAKLPRYAEDGTEIPDWKETARKKHLLTAGFGQWIIIFMFIALAWFVFNEDYQIYPLNFVGFVTLGFSACRFYIAVRNGMKSDKTLDDLPVVEKRNWVDFSVTFLSSLAEVLYLVGIIAIRAGIFPLG